MIIRHSKGTYEIRFVTEAEALQALVSTYTITDRNLARFYPDVSKLVLAFPPGERTKNLSNFAKAHEWLAESGATRASKIAAFGGGVIGDLVGFIAATYMRGVPYTQIPTTLLAQVDSAVGGKVAVDIPAGKNLVGAFYPPTEVLICTELLRSLPKRQVRNGMAEVLKYGFISTPSLLNTSATYQNVDWDEVVRTCVMAKAEVVQADEFETLGMRASLNFGHTVGHAIEKILCYKTLLHGEAISIGMVVEAKLGEAIGVTPRGTAKEVERVLALHSLPTTYVLAENAAELIQAMRSDKKRKSDNLAFSLLIDIGQCKLFEEIHPFEVEKILKSV